MPEMEEQAIIVSPQPQITKPHFVLVHGIGGGSWCWYKIRCLMENSGFKVSCVDLKSAGIDRSDADSVLDFDKYNEPLFNLMSSLPENEQVILVGHSAGGLSVTRMTQKFAKKIRLCVYVAATMLKHGYSTEQDFKQGTPDLSEYGDVYELGFGAGIDKAPTSSLLKKEFQRKIAYHMSPQEDSTLASMLLRPGPLTAILSAKFCYDDDEDGDVAKVGRVFIKTVHDRVVTVEQQEAMIARWWPSQVYSLDSDHSPFFSNPFMLFGLLVKSAASVGYSSS